MKVLGKEGQVKAGWSMRRLISPWPKGRLKVQTLRHRDDHRTLHAGSRRTRSSHRAELPRHPLPPGEDVDEATGEDLAAFQGVTEVTPVPLQVVRGVLVWCHGCTVCSHAARPPTGRQDDWNKWKHSLRSLSPRDRV